MIHLVLMAMIAPSVAAHELPQWARGGLIGKQLLSATRSTGEWGIYESKLDNFDNSSSTFSQRYVVDAQYWNGKGPVFYTIGGEVRGSIYLVLMLLFYYYLY